MTRNEDAYVYYDKGVDHFGTTFKHYLKATYKSGDSSSQCYIWAVSNVVDDGHQWYSNSDVAMGLWLMPVGTNLYLYLEDYHGGTNDHSILPTPGASYYYTVERTTSTHVECRIYSNPSRTTLIDTISLSINYTDKYRYIFGTNSYNDGYSDSISCDIEYLNLDEC